MLAKPAGLRYQRASTGLAASFSVLEPRITTYCNG